MLNPGAVAEVAHTGWWRRVGEVSLVGSAIGLDLLVWGGDRVLRWGQPLPWWVVPVLTAVVYAALLLRWRRPRAVFILHWAYSLAGFVLPGYGPFTGLLIALYAVARQDSRRAAGTALAASTFPFAVHSYNLATTNTRGDAPGSIFAGSMVLFAALTLTVWGLGRLARAAEQRAEEEQRQQASAAVRAERLHLARELHDIVSHSVSAMILQAAGARTLVSRDDEQVRAALEAIETTGVQAMSEMHRLLGLLRAAGPEYGSSDSSPAQSLHDLESLVSSTRASGVDVEVVTDGHPTELDPSVGLAAYRIVQEALTNTIKHAGRGASARIHLHWEPDGLTLTVRDRVGIGAHEAGGLSSGHGLPGLAERVTLVGGSLEAGPVADGFLVRAHLPAPPPVLNPGPPATTRKEAP